MTDPSEALATAWDEGYAQAIRESAHGDYSRPNPYGLNGGRHE